MNKRVSEAALCAKEGTRVSIYKKNCYPSRGGGRERGKWPRFEVRPEFP